MGVQGQPQIPHQANVVPSGSWLTHCPPELPDLSSPDTSHTACSPWLRLAWASRGDSAECTKTRWLLPRREAWGKYHNSQLHLLLLHGERRQSRFCNCQNQCMEPGEVLPRAGHMKKASSSEAVWVMLQHEIPLQLFWF